MELGLAGLATRTFNHLATSLTHQHKILLSTGLKDVLELGRMCSGNKKCKKTKQKTLTEFSLHSL